MCNREGVDREVWVFDPGCVGVIVGPMGAYYTTINYIYGGVEFEVLMENEEFELIEDDEFE